MKMLCSVQLSKHRYKTPEGYLVCKDCIIARTGKQTYLKSELFGVGEEEDDYIDVDRKPQQVFDERTMASFEGKPLTIEHPEESVSPENYKSLSVGNVHNVHRGMFEGQEVLYADINVYDAEAINLIESGEMVELSCGYDCDITEGDHPEQINIRGNHVALCEQGRAGIARIQDSKWGIKPIVKDAVGRGTLIQEFGKYGEQYKIRKIEGNVMYCEDLVNGKVFLFKRDKENIDWAVIKKSDVKDSLVVETWDIILETTKAWHFVLNDVENWVQEKYGYTLAEVKEKADKGERMLQCIELEFANVGETEIQKLSIGPFDSEADAKEFYAKELAPQIAKIKNDKEEEITVSYAKQIHKVGDSNIKYVITYKDPSGHWLYFNSALELKQAKKYDNLEEANKVKETLIKESKEILADYEAKLKEHEDPEMSWYPVFIEREKLFLETVKVIPLKESGLEDAKEEKVAPNRFSDEFTKDELAKFVKEQYKDKSTDAITNGMKPSPKRKKKIFVNEAAKDAFLDSLTEEAEGRVDGFDTVFPDDRYLYYWEVYYWPEKEEKKDSVKELSFTEWMKKDYPAALEHWEELTDFEKSEVKKEYKLYLLEHDEVKDEEPKQFVISLDEHDWLDDNDKPTQDPAKARRFNSFEEASKHQKTYCKGTVVSLNDTFSPLSVKQEIENILEPITHGTIEEEFGALNIPFDNKEDMRAAYKKLMDQYDVEKFIDDDNFEIKVYNKFKIEDSEWKGYNLRRGRPAQDFKQYLRDRGFEFEPSENGEFIHFEVKNPDEDVAKEIRAINQHYTKVGLYDDYSRRFYVKAIETLNNKLKKLERNELLDANQKDYQEQKAKMIKEIKEQIAQYEKKLNELD